MVEEHKAQSKPSESPDSIQYVNLYESESKIYTRKISGFFQKIRRYTGIPLVFAFLIMPWLTIHDRPAILFDLDTRQFHVLTVTFWPQDFMLLSWALIISAFLLFTVTVMVGRVWCGFTCPQTVWTLMFIYVEHLCEGDRNKRIKLDKQSLGMEKFLRKASKHLLWLLIAFITGATFVGYFIPVRELLAGFIPHFNGDSWIKFNIDAAVAFWTLLFTGMTYLNAGWLREQVCKYMCPYARIQSVMYDKDTLAVQYDATRGEKRGPRKPGDDHKAQNLGDCIDCSWCVQVCPVNIDIRDGLQYECINCGLCVDACNSVMDKMSYPKGLIRFTSEDELAGEKTYFLRPRLIGYFLALVAMIGAFAYVLYTRKPLVVDVIRDRSARMYRVMGEDVQNVYSVKIGNMDAKEHSYHIELKGDLPYVLLNYHPKIVKNGEVFTFPLRVSAPLNSVKQTEHELIFSVRADDATSIEASENTLFVAPTP